MQLVTDTEKSPSVAGASVAEVSAVPSTYSEYRIIRRNGAVVSFDPSGISVAVTKAFLAIEGWQSAPCARVRDWLQESLPEVRSVGIIKLHSVGVQRRQSWVN